MSVLRLQTAEIRSAGPPRAAVPASIFEARRTRKSIFVFTPDAGQDSDYSPSIDWSHRLSRFLRFNLSICGLQQLTGKSLSRTQLARLFRALDGCHDRHQGLEFSVAVVRNTGSCGKAGFAGLNYVLAGAPALMAGKPEGR